MITPYDEQNSFAKILRKDLPSIEVYQDNYCYAFMDIMPQAEGHVLVIPKEPAVTLLTLPSLSAQQLIIGVQLVANAIQTAFSQGVSIFQLNGQQAGQTVDHVHFHVLPGSLPQLSTHASTQADTTQLHKTAEKIKAYLHTSI